MNTKSIQSLAVGDTFSILPGGTIYTVSWPTRVGAGLATVTYRTESGCESTFTRAALTPAYLV